jgi:hypothetical protein
LLHAPVVAAAYQSPIRSEDGCANGDAAFGEAGAGFFDGDGEHGGVVEVLFF